MIELCKKIDCTGCAACYNSCGHNSISMKADQEGFLNPIIDHDTCVECGLCVKSCPVIEPFDMSNHKMQCYAAFAKDNRIRKHGSSGGLFTIISDYILEKDGVIVGAAMNDAFIVNHQIAETRQDLKSLQGSKYVQSNIGLIFKDIRKILNSGKLVLFVGVSCQVAGLLKFLRKDYENLYTIDLACHGVPSLKAFSKYLEMIRNNHPNIISFKFRDLRAWNCNSCNINVKGITKFSHEKMLYGIDSSYFPFFINGYMNREACYHCPYAQSEHRIGDITLADFWGIGKAKPYKHKTQRGVSLISTNTPKGAALFEEIKARIEYEARDVNETIVYGENHQLKSPAKRPVQRDEFYKLLDKMSWSEIVSYYNPKTRKKPSIYNRIKINIKRLLMNICDELNIKI